MLIEYITKTSSIKSVAPKKTNIIATKRERGRNKWVKSGRNGSYIYVTTFYSETFW